MTQPPQQFIDPSKLPLEVRLGNWGIATSIGLLVIGNVVAKGLDKIFPGNGPPVWLWPVLYIIWTPGILGFLLSFYSIVRYPYLSLATGGLQLPGFTRTWIWTFLGVIFYFLGTSFLLLGVGSRFAPTPPMTKSELVLVVYLAIELLFIGFLLATYKLEKHVTVSTFIELTFGFGILLFPIYLPFILIGSVRCRQRLNALKNSRQQAVSDSGGEAS